MVHVARNLRVFLSTVTGSFLHLLIKPGSMIMLFLMGSLPSWVFAGEQPFNLEKWVNPLAQELVSIRRHLHMYPELSNREFKTSAYIAETLRSMGMDEVITGVAKTGVVGILHGNKPGPVVAVRADMDALPVDETIDVPYRSRNPGVKHACGHDVHMTVALGTARTLLEMRKAGMDIPGKVVFIFQPAEEGAPPGEEGGASLVVKEGILEKYNIEAIFGLHANPELPVGVVGYRAGPLLASSDRFEILIKGKQTHGAFPHLGIDPVYLGALVVVQLQGIVSRQMDPREPVVISVGIFEAGRRFNIIPDQARLVGTVRTLNPEIREQIPRRMETLIKGIVQSAGAQYTFQYQPGPPVTINSAELVEKMLPSIKDEIGESNVVEVKPVMGAEDFAFYAEKIPGFYFWLGVRNPADTEIHPLHSPEFDADERSLPVGVRVMTRLVLDYLRQSSS